MVRRSAAEMFRLAVDRVGGAATAASAIGCTRQAVYLWMAGERVPSRDSARRIERALGVRASEWC